MSRPRTRKPRVGDDYQPPAAVIPPPIVSDTPHPIVVVCKALLNFLVTTAIMLKAALMLMYALCLAFVMLVGALVLGGIGLALIYIALNSM